MLSIVGDVAAFVRAVEDASLVVGLGPSQLSDVVFLLIAGVFWFLDVAIRRHCAVKLGVNDAVFRLIILYLVNSISLNRNMNDVDQLFFS